MFLLATIIIRSNVLQAALFLLVATNYTEFIKIYKNHELSYTEFIKINKTHKDKIF